VQDHQPTTGDDGAHTESVDLLGLVARHWLLIVMVCVGAAGIGAMYVRSAPNHYRASAQIQIERLTTVTGQLDRMGGTPTFDPAALATECVTITSPAVISEAVADPRIARSDLWHGRPDLVPYIRERLKVEQVGETQVLRLLFEDSNRERASRVLGVLIDAYRNYKNGEERRRVRRDIQTLASRCAQLRPQVEAAKQALADFVAAKGIFSQTLGKGSPDADRLDAYRSALLEAEIARQQAESDLSTRMEFTRHQWTDLLLGVENAGHGVASLRSLCVKSEQEVARLAARLGDEHPDLVAAKEQADRLRRELNDWVLQKARTTMARTRESYEVARSREEALRRTCQRQERIVALQHRHHADYEDMKAKVNDLERVRRGLKGRMDHLDALGALAVWHVRPLNGSALPIAQIGPQRKQVLAVSLVLGLTLALGMVLFVERWSVTRAAGRTRRRQHGEPQR